MNDEKTDELIEKARKASRFSSKITLELDLNLVFSPDRGGRTSFSDMPGLSFSTDGEESEEELGQVFSVEGIGDMLLHMGDIEGRDDDVSAAVDYLLDAEQVWRALREELEKRGFLSSKTRRAEND